MQLQEAQLEMQQDSSMFPDKWDLLVGIVSREGDGTCGVSHLG